MHRHRHRLLEWQRQDSRVINFLVVRQDKSPFGEERRHADKRAGRQVTNYNNYLSVSQSDLSGRAFLDWDLGGRPIYMFAL